MALSAQDDAQPPGQGWGRGGSLRINFPKVMWPSAWLPSVATALAPAPSCLQSFVKRMNRSQREGPRGAGGSPRSRAGTELQPVARSVC